MKHRLITFICLLAISICSTVACATERLLPNLKKQDGLTSVYVGKALLRMSGASRGLAVPGVNIEAMGKNLDSIDIITADNAGTSHYLRKLAIRAVKNLRNVELAMENQTDGATTQIYVVPSAGGKSYTRLIILVGQDTDVYTVIDMQGNIPLDVLGGSF